VARDEYIVAGARPEVENRVAGLETGMFDRQATAQPEICFGHMPRHVFVGAAHQIEAVRGTATTWPAAAGPTGRDLSVFLPDLVPDLFNTIGHHVSFPEG